MTAERSVVLDGAPSTVTGYARSVILPRRSLKRGDIIPGIDITRRGFTIDADHLARFRTLCGWELSAHLPFVYPLSWLFHYHLGHTQRIVSDCVRRLPDSREVGEAESLRLDVAFKGPIYYGSELVMRGATRDDGYRFDLYCGKVDKPAMPGSIHRVKADHDLFAGTE